MTGHPDPRAVPDPPEPAAAPAAPAAEPVADRPVIPEGYGLPPTTEGLLSWGQVEAALVAASHYWVVSVRPDGRPHAVPRWGVWLDDRFWYDGSPATRHARNVAANPAVTLHLESGRAAVIVEGESHAASADPATLGARLSAAFGKYRQDGYVPAADAWSGADGGGLRVITPRRAVAWFDFPKDCTRFRFPAG